MPENELEWYKKWFNKDYLKLYSHRSRKEATGQIDFLIRAISLKGSETILDLGCGSGRHTLELAKRGYTVTGVDISQTLIEEGRKSLKNHPEMTASLISEDIFSLENLPQYDVVLSLFTSFGYFEKDEDNEKFFQVVSSHLAEKGKFFLDFLHPSQVVRDLVPNEEIEVEGAKVKISRSIKNGQVIKDITFTDPKRTYQEKVKLYTRGQIEEMMGSYSLKIVDAWNDYEGNPWRSEGERQLFYCTKV